MEFNILNLILDICFTLISNPIILIDKTDQMYTHLTCMFITHTPVMKYYIKQGQGMWCPQIVIRTFLILYSGSINKKSVSDIIKLDIYFFTTYWNKQWSLSIKLVKHVCVCVSVAEVIVENMYFSYEISLNFFIFQVFVYNIHVLYSSTEQQTVVLLPRSPSTSKTYLPIPVDNLEEEYRIRSADDGKLFREEYNVSVSWKNMDHG